MSLTEIIREYVDLKIILATEQQTAKWEKGARERIKRLEEALAQCEAVLYHGH